MTWKKRNKIRTIHWDIFFLNNIEVLVSPVLVLIDMGGNILDLHLKILSSLIGVEWQMVCCIFKPQTMIHLEAM